MKNAKLLCPSCGQLAGIPLVWGDADQETWEASVRGEVVLAGCMIEPISGAAPDYACLNCAYRWDGT